MDTLRKQFLAHLGQTSPNPLLIGVERAEGIYFYTPEGKRYTDLIAGVSVSNVGHNNPRVVEAICAQARCYTHVMVYGELIERPQVQLARRLVERLDPALDSVYFVNSGAEAIEGALKLAKRRTGRTEIVSFRNAYHGSTHGAMSIQGGDAFTQAYRPLLPDVARLDFNAFDQLCRITERTACVVVEPVQGEAGVRLPADGFLQALRRRCDEVGALLIFDEIQTGLGRCGAWFAHQLAGVVPDILVLAKALGGGMPLGAFVSSKAIMDGFQTDPPLGHITTFGGHPVCCAAGLAALEYIEDNGLIARVEALGQRFERTLSAHAAVCEVRRSGLLMAVELGSPKRLFRAMEAFVQAGILTDWFLFCDTAFRISPPLTITPEQVDQVCRTLSEALTEALGDL